MRLSALDQLSMFVPTLCREGRQPFAPSLSCFFVDAGCVVMCDNAATTLCFPACVNLLDDSGANQTR